MLIGRKIASSKVISEVKKPILESIAGTASNGTKAGTNGKKTLGVLVKELVLSKLAGLTKKEVKRLSKLDTNEFIGESYNLICKSQNIPEHLRPLLRMEPLGEKMRAFYSWSLGTIAMNQNLKNKPGAKLFSTLGHEINHVKQNYDVLRTEFLGEKAVAHYADDVTNCVMNNFRNIFDAPGINIETMKEELGPSYELVKSYYKAKSQGAEPLKNWLDAEAKKERPLYYEKLKDLKKQIVDYYCEIKAGTADAKRTQEYFDGMIGNGRNFTSFKSFFKFHEIEAYFTTGVNYYEYLIRKFI